MAVIKYENIVMVLLTRYGKSGREIRKSGFLLSKDRQAVRFLGVRIKLLFFITIIGNAYPHDFFWGAVLSCCFLSRSTTSCPPGQAKNIYTTKKVEGGEGQDELYMQLFQQLNLDPHPFLWGQDSYGIK